MTELSFLALVEAARAKENARLAAEAEQERIAREALTKAQQEEQRENERVWQLIMQGADFKSLANEVHSPAIAEALEYIHGLVDPYVSYWVKPFMQAEQQVVDKLRFHLTIKPFFEKRMTKLSLGRTCGFRIIGSSAEPSSVQRGKKGFRHIPFEFVMLMWVDETGTAGYGYVSYHWTGGVENDTKVYTLNTFRSLKQLLTYLAIKCQGGWKNSVGVGENVSLIFVDAAEEISS